MKVVEQQPCAARLKGALTSCHRKRGRGYGVYVSAALWPQASGVRVPRGGPAPAPPPRDQAAQSGGLNPANILRSVSSSRLSGFSESAFALQGPPFMTREPGSAHQNRSLYLLSAAPEDL